MPMVSLSFVPHRVPKGWFPVKKLFAVMLCAGMLAGIMLPIVGCTETKKVEPAKPAAEKAKEKEKEKTP